MGACGNVNVNANANFFEHDLLWLADARYSFSLQKITEKTEKYRILLACGNLDMNDNLDLNLVPKAASTL